MCVSVLNCSQYASARSLLPLYLSISLINLIDKCSVRLCCVLFLLLLFLPCLIRVAICRVQDNTNYVITYTTFIITEGMFGWLAVGGWVVIENANEARNGYYCSKICQMSDFELLT